MRAIGLAIVIAVCAAGPARAESCGFGDLYRAAESLVQRLTGGAPARGDVIAPPGNIDRQMALAPPPGGTLRIVPPPERLRQQ